MSADLPADPAVLRDLATEVAREAADLLTEGLDRSRTIATKSTATDLVTEMDEAAEALIRRRLLGARPDDGMVGEEGTDETGTSGVRWIVDPLDGTTNYVYGHAGFNVSIAAEAGGTVVAGAVVDPLHGEVFAAGRGLGSTRNGTPIACSAETGLDRALVATGFNYDADRRAHQARVLVGLLPRVRDIRRMGAAAVDLCSVACGRVDGYYEWGLAPWDVAAGALIASEAGAVVHEVSMVGPWPGSVVAAGPALAGALAHLLDESIAAAGPVPPPAGGR